MRIGLAHRDDRDAAAEALRAAREVLVGLGVTAVDVPLGPVQGGPAVADGVAGLDLVVSLGGDGTFLRTAHLARDHGVPVLGVNVGRLGFLAEVALADLATALARVADGDLAVEERATLEVEVLGPDGAVRRRDWALNEVAVEKAARQRLVRLDVELDGSLFTRVAADAVIVATSTGSTAYALSAGGPIVSPAVEATLVVPVAPHSLFDRTIVTGPREPVEIALASDEDAALVTCDGRDPTELVPGGRVRVVGGGRPVRFATLGPPGFFALVRRTFGLR